MANGDSERKYAEKMKAQGMVKCCIWVYQEDAHRVKVFAEGLRTTKQIMVDKDDEYCKQTT